MTVTEPAPDLDSYFSTLSLLSTRWSEVHRGVQEVELCSDIYGAASRSTARDAALFGVAADSFLPGLARLAR